MQALRSYEDDDESSSLESMDDSVDDRDYKVNEEESTESESSNEEFCEQEPRSSRGAKEIVEEREDVMDDGNTSSTGENQQETSLVDNVADIDWSISASEYKPLFELSAAKNGVVMCPLDRSATPFDAFNCLFPPSLFIHVAEKTNKRIEIENRKKKCNNKFTDAGEIMIMLGCTMIMGYNTVPKLELYWSGNKSLNNECISKAISRDRFRFLFSRMYFADPEKPGDASKTYYIDEVVTCFKHIR